MKHRLTIPYASELHQRWADLLDFLGDRGWGIVEEHVYQPNPTHRARLQITISPLMWPAVIRAESGMTLVFDDAAQTMGVTPLAEPRDARTVAPEDAVSQTFLERHADMSLLQDDEPPRLPPRLLPFRRWK